MRRTPTLTPTPTPTLALTRTLTLTLTLTLALTLTLTLAPTLSRLQTRGDRVLPSGATDEATWLLYSGDGLSSATTLP